jgi:hypothetical protein
LHQQLTHHTHTATFLEHSFPLKRHFSMAARVSACSAAVLVLLIGAVASCSAATLNAPVDAW